MWFAVSLILWAYVGGLEKNLQTPDEGQIRRKNVPLASRFSTSPKVVGTDTARSDTYDFLLVIHSNYRSISTVFEINGDFGRKKKQIFPTPSI